MSGSAASEFDLVAQEKGPLRAACWLVDYLRAENRYGELFEALKMRIRLSMGLAPVASESDAPLSESQNDELERGLIEACREVGVKLLAAGKLEEGWMYMRAVGDLPAAADAMKEVPVNEANLDTLLSLWMQEGIDPARGTLECLKHRGTCNTITMLESVVAMRGRTDQQSAVAVLVDSVHAEVLENVQQDILRREGKLPHESTLADILLSRPDLLKDGAYHMDTTHIASTVRFARVLDKSESLEKALDLAIYGRNLHSQYQYAGEEPFEPLYAMSLAFFRALLGVQIEIALQLFLRKAEELPVPEFGTVAIETYVDLLARIGRYDAALKAMLQKMPDGVRPVGVAPSLLELSKLANDYEPMRLRCKEIGDLIGYAAATTAELQSAGTRDK